MRTYATILLLVLSLLPGAAPAASADAAYQQARLDYFALRKDEKRSKFRHHWLKVISALDRGANQLRGDARCGALFNAARAWHDLSEISYLQDDRAEAIARYSRVADGCPRSNLADDALFHTAELQQKRDPDAARRSLDKLLAAHASGDRARDARVLRSQLPPPQKQPTAVASRPTPASAPTRPASTTSAAAPQQATAASASRTAAPATQAAAASASVSSTRAASAAPQTSSSASPASAASASAPSTAAAASQSAAATASAGAAPTRGSSTAGAPASAVAAASATQTTAAPQGGAAAEPIAGAGLPSAVDILAALDAKGADANRPEDVALAEDLRRDRMARAPSGAAAAVAPAPAAAQRPAATQPPAPTLDRDRLAALEKATGGEIPLSLAAGLKVRRVVIDPGHGGKDTGAIGKRGTREKDLVLNISRKLKKRLEAMGLEVLLTRNRDEFLELEERTRFANDSHADLFISVHVNAAENRRAYGIETYTLNLNSDRYAMRLAARENASSSKSIGDLQFILADLATKANTDDSVRLARLVQGEMVGTLRRSYGTKIRDLGVKQALFFVLVGAKMPAILVEAAFVSNPDEELRLRSDKYQEETARSIAEGVRRFIAEREAIAEGRAPSGTGSSGVF